ncbi:hypothetical protein [Paraburkholderia xenovorans]
MAHISEPPEKFDQWAIVEIFGHQRIAGRVTEQQVGGSSFVRVDVPACEATERERATQAFTKLYGQGAIYAISFVDEAAARMTARQLRVQPIDTWALRRALEDMPAIGNDSRQRHLGDGDSDIPYRSCRARPFAPLTVYPGSFAPVAGATGDSLFIPPLNSDPDRLLEGSTGTVERTPTGIVHRIKG